MGGNTTLPQPDYQPETGTEPQPEPEPKPEPKPTNEHGDKDLQTLKEDDKSEPQPEPEPKPEPAPPKEEVQLAEVNNDLGAVAAENKGSGASSVAVSTALMAASVMAILRFFYIFPLLFSECLGSLLSPRQQLQQRVLLFPSL